MTSRLRDLALKHPYLAFFILCALCSVFDQRNGSHVILPVAILLLVFQVFLIVLAGIFVAKQTNIKKSILFCAILSICCFYIDYNFTVSVNSDKYVLLAGILVGFTFIYLFNLKGRLSTEQLIFIIFIFGFVMRLTYVLSVSINNNQHDFGGSRGHFAYIEYFYKNGFFKFPEVVTEGLNQKYHPPFYHMIAALWMKIQAALQSVLLGLSIDDQEVFLTAKENLQLITLFFSSASMIISYKIFRLVGVKDNGLLIATSLVAFHPTFSILAGSANNDCLSVTLFLASMLCALQWFKNPTIGNIIKTALAIGFGMMTKLSVGLVAPAIALLFAIKFFESKQFKKFAKQFVTFGILVFPLGLWWGIRNLIKSGIPITYVPKLPTENHSQYIGFRSVWERLFDFNYTDVWMARGLKYGYTYHEYSLGLMILKTSMFGEYYIGKNNTWSYIFANALFYVNAIICIVSLASLIYLTVKKSKVISAPLRAFFGVLYITIMGFYIKFSFDFPHDCSMDFRYIVPTVIIGALFLGLAQNATQNNSGRLSKTFNSALYALVIAFFSCSFSLFTSISS